MTALSTYGAIIRPPHGASRPLAQSIDDAVDVLGKVTGVRFAVDAAARDRGIVLVRTDEKEAAEQDVARLTNQGSEAFVIRSDDPSTLSIVANSDAGLVQGLYFYLREIGCRWFFPGENWTVLPARRDVTLRIDKLVKPAFRMRSFFGTGGFGSSTPVDPGRLMAVRWETWKRRNGFGGEFLLAGHSYEAFNTAHRGVLEEHPEYMALVNGKRQPWALGTKFCVSNPELVQLYTDDRLKELRRLIAAEPEGPRSFAVSVEPSDGNWGGYCECERCRAIGAGSPSDQAFFLANQVAKVVAEELPGRRVSLYAYSDHAAPPAIALEPNVYVALIPEGLQRTGLTAEELIAAWHEKTRALSLYTYWSVPDWNNDSPTFDYTTLPREKLRYWHEHGIEGVSLETSTSAGAMGIGLYVTSRLLWDPYADDRALTREFYDLSFGPAAAPMQRMLERWAQGFTLSDFELGLSFRDLAEARRLSVSQPGVQRRVADYESYLDYLRLWLEYQEAPRTSLERTERARAVMVAVYRMYESAMVHSHRIQQLVSNRYERETTLRAEFDPKNPAASGWELVRTAPPAMSLTELSLRYPVIEVPERTYLKRLVPLPATSVAHAKLRAPEATAKPLLFGGPTDFEIEVPPGAASFDIGIRVQKSRTSVADTVSVRGPGFGPPFRSTIPADGEEHVVCVPAPIPGRYVAHVEDQKATFFLKPPRGMPTVFRTFASPLPSPRVYFLVPKGLNRVALFANGAGPIQIYDGDGQVVPHRGSRVLILEVPAGQDGRVWSLQGYKGWERIRMLNVPQVFAMSPDALLAPLEAGP